MDSITPNYSNESIPKPIENEINSDSSAPIPAQNAQNYTPQEYNNQNNQLKYILRILISHILIVQINLKIILIIVINHILSKKIKL